MTDAPARLLNIQGGRLEQGVEADLAIVDMTAPWVVDADLLKSASRNTTFEARALKAV